MERLDEKSESPTPLPPAHSSWPALTRARLFRTLLLLTGLLFAASLASLAFGPEESGLFELLFGGGGRALERTILFEVRLPRVILGAAVGAALGAAGAALQALLRNPLADPYVLGLSGGSALGGTVAILASSALASAGVSLGIFSGVFTEAMSFGGAVLALTVIWRLARVSGEVSPYTLLLAGTVFNAFTAAVITFVEAVVSAEKAQEILFWLMGTLGSAPGWGTVLAASGAALVTALGLTFYAPAMNLLSLGEEAAMHGGVDVQRTQRGIFLLVSLGVGLTVSATGLIGFVGLIVPHMLRILLGADLRRLIPGAALGGAAFLVACDLGARVAFSWLLTEPPVGVITAMFGGPFFLWLLRREIRQRG